MPKKMSGLSFQLPTADPVDITLDQKHDIFTTYMSDAFSREDIERVFGMPFSEGNRVTLISRGGTSFRTIFDSLEQAKRFICLQFYIFRNDETGIELAAILKKKAIEGVSIYILYDHFGSIGTPVSFWKNLADAGIGIRASRPFKWSDPLHYIHRDHRKMIIIDGIKAFTGGINIANEYRGFKKFRKKRAWRDTAMLLEGPIVTDLFDNFRSSWVIWKGMTIPPSGRKPPFEDGLPAVPIFASSARGRRRFRKLLYHSIDNAKDEICLTTAYFTPSRHMIKVLSMAVSRGVRVRLLLPGISDVTSAWYAGRAFFSQLLKAGVEIYTYKGTTLHAKSAVFDGRWSIIGSANLDFQSLRRNDEGNVGIVDERFGRKMIAIFNNDIAGSDRVNLDAWSRRPLAEKLKEHFFALFRRRL